MITLGIIGNGFVGSAVSYGFDTAQVRQMIVDPRNSSTTVPELVDAQPTAVFLCLPTPSGPDGSVDATALTDTLDALSRYNYEGLVVIKSTVTPDIMKSINDTYTLSIVYNPEFLTERYANYDFVHPELQLFGGNRFDCDRLELLYGMYSKVTPSPIFKTDIISASLAKYTFNSFFATKVTFMNEIFDLHQKSGADSSWDEFTKILGADYRIGPEHLRVPGPDGKRGFGGNCFPKDTAAFIKYADTLNSELSVLETAVNTNSKIRK